MLISSEEANKINVNELMNFPLFLATILTEYNYAMSRTE